ncbi:hypothetical protein ACSFA3_15125 [Variovorax sp. RHLX14]|uniref:hypothetical protein n=1 Tax=Variovorax sp. RHLX14 TaxID=1259731 RepID=UPI003F4519AC
MSNISVDSSVRSRAGSVTQALRSEQARDPGAFTRKVADGVGRPFRGPMEARELISETQPTTTVIGFTNTLLNTRYNEATAGTGSRRNEIALTLDNGDTAIVRGDEQNRNFRIRTQRGVVLEGSFGSGGAHAIRGFRTPMELRNELLRVHRANGWENAHALPDR